MKQQRRTTFNRCRACLIPNINLVRTWAATNEEVRHDVYWSDNDVVWIAEAPDLDQCAAQGHTPEQAMAELRTAMELWLEVAWERGLAVPEPRYQLHTVAAE